MNRKKTLFTFIAAILTTAIVSSVLTYYITKRKIDTGEIYLKNETYAELMKYFELEKVQDIINEYYVKDVDADALEKGTLDGMVAGAKRRFFRSSIPRKNTSFLMKKVKVPVSARAC